MTTARWPMARETMPSRPPSASVRDGEARKRDRRSDAEEKQRHQATQRREGCSARVEVYIIDPGQSFRSDAYDDANQPVGAADPERGSQYGEQRMLDENLLHEPRASAAERRTDRHLVAARPRFPEQDAGDVRTRDQ